MHVLREVHLCHAESCVRSKMTQEVDVLEIPLGRNIRRLRLARNMTQRELAWHLRVSVQAVSKWERERAYPDLALLLPMSEQSSSFTILITC